MLGAAVDVDDWPFADAIVLDGAKALAQSLAPPPSVDNLKPEAERQDVKYGVFVVQSRVEFAARLEDTCGFGERLFLCRAHSAERHLNRRHRMRRSGAQCSRRRRR